MASAKSPLDQFDQRAYIEMSQSVANELTFTQLNITNGLSLGAVKYGIVIDRVQLLTDTTDWPELLAGDDRFYFGLALTDSLPTVNMKRSEVLWLKSFGVQKAAAALSSSVIEYFPEWNFTDIGGLLAPLDRIYGFMGSEGLANPIALELTFWYHVIELSKDNYWELLEARQVLGT